MKLAITRPNDVIKFVREKAMYYPSTIFMKMQRIRMAPMYHIECSGAAKSDVMEEFLIADSDSLTTPAHMHT